MERVALRLAFEWTCPECGIDHFERSMTPDFGPDKIEEMKSEQGIDDETFGQFVTMPRIVICSGCKAQYSTFDDDEDDDEDDEDDDDPDWVDNVPD